MLFLQGTRDALADLDQLKPLCQSLGARATLTLFQDADHSFHVPARSGLTDPQVRSDVLDALVTWIDGIIGPSAHGRDAPRTSLTYPLQVPKKPGFSSKLRASDYFHFCHKTVT